MALAELHSCSTDHHRSPVLYSEATVARSFDAPAINAIFNDPTVFRHVAMLGQAELDLTPLIEDRRNVFMLGDGLCFWFHDRGAGFFEIHSAALPSVRGRGTLRAVQEAIRHVFLATECVEIWTKVPQGNLAAAALTRAAGFRLDAEREGVWPTVDGRTIGLSYWLLGIRDWARTAPGLVERGQWFHDKLDSERQRLGLPDEDNHADDPAHDRHVGTALAMIAAGQVEKGLGWYTLMARQFGYGAVRPVKANPLVLDIGNGDFLQFTADHEGFNLLKELPACLPAQQ